MLEITSRYEHMYVNINEWSGSSKFWASYVCINNYDDDKIKQFEMGGVCGTYEG
jgi:hypothetical protein